MEDITTWVDQLIEEYTDTRAELVRFRERLKQSNDDIDQEDSKHVSSMISDMTYSLDWMKRGRRPGNRRGIDRRSVYQRSAYMDMDIFPEVQEPSTSLTYDEKRNMVEVLLEFSDRERECYLMHMAKGFSYSQIANFLGISRRTVQQYIDRAKGKLANLI